LNENFLTNELLDESEEARDLVTITVNGVSTPINSTTVKLAHLEQVLEERERSAVHDTRHENSVIGRKRPRSPSLEMHYETQQPDEALNQEFEIEELLSDDEEQFEVEELDDSDEERLQQSSAANLADNMTLIDGQMIVWTKDEDRLILSAVRDSGPKPETWNALAVSHLPQRTSKQIAERYAQLMELLKKIQH
jgi:hypothetical protein